ncbi:MAG: hypothetical protein JWN71_2753 [Xanthobacteraceae bacterium]|jgi:hypothetical protein|nr:hypothetical protein [Xanthobacteraceae bacterium]
MRYLPLAAAVAATLLTGLSATAQQLPNLKPLPAPAVAPAKPYKPVAVTVPAKLADPALDALRKQLADVAKSKDKAALGRLVVAKGFFWETEKGDTADKGKSGIDNLAKAIGLDGKDAGGWETLAGYAGEPNAAAMPARKGIVCAPAEPTFNEKALDEVVQATGTDPGEWGYTVSPGVEVRSAAKADAPVSEKLGQQFVRVMMDNSAADPSFLRIVTPSGKVGFIKADALAPLGNDQLCYVKDGAAWKITGFIGPGQ